MTKIDKSYLEKLGEVLYDEKKAINYKTVSIMLGVHVNIAKQMLHHLHKVGKEDGKKVYATYYVSGVMPRNVIMSLQRKYNHKDMDTSNQSSMGDLDGFLVAICKEKDLDEFKSKFNKIFSVHMYSLSTFPIDNNDILENLVEFPLRDREGRTPVEFGPITCSASKKLLENVRAIPVSEDALKTNKDELKKINDIIKESTKESSKSNMGKSEETSKNDSVSESKSQGKPAPVSIDKQGGGRLKSMFATAATKPKPQKAKHPETVKPDTNNVQHNEENKLERNEKSSSVQSKDSRKRKRIRDVLSSDSEDEGKKSEDDDDCIPESPIPRKRIQIDSDSDDDLKEISVKKVDPPSSNDVKIATSGRKRVAKMISKSFMDKDGFLVTTKEQVMVSEDEDGGNDNQNSKRPNADTKSVKEVSTKTKESQPVQSSAPKHSAASGKTKQASLMSFFQKK